MFQSIKITLIMSIGILLTGCAGKDFVRPTPEAFKLGTSTYAQVTQQLGEPRREGSLLKNEKTVKSITYAYASTGGEALETGVIAARAMTYYFLNDALVGQEFGSSFKSDNTNFDDAKIGAIEKEKTTREEVVQLLGRPSATYIAPMVKMTSGNAIGYTYSSTKGGVIGGFKFFRKTLLISFNDKNQVADIEFSSSGNK